MELAYTAFLHRSEGFTEKVDVSFTLPEFMRGDEGKLLKDLNPFRDPHKIISL